MPNIAAQQGPSAYPPFLSLTGGAHPSAGAGHLLPRDVGGQVRDRGALRPRPAPGAAPRRAGAPGWEPPRPAPHPDRPCPPNPSASPHISLRRAPFSLCPPPPGENPNPSPPLKRRSRAARSQGWPPARASGRRAAVPVAARRSRGRVSRLLRCSVPRQGKGRRRPEDHRSADPRTGLLAPWLASSGRRRSTPSSRTTPAVAANWSSTPGNAKPLLSFARRKPVRR
jgi:hypothetical protein